MLDAKPGKLTEMSYELLAAAVLLCVLLAIWWTRREASEGFTASKKATEFARHAGAYFAGADPPSYREFRREVGGGVGEEVDAAHYDDAMRLWARGELEPERVEAIL